MPTYRRTYRYLAAALAALLLGEGLLPSTALALTSGPSQPEFSNFQPVATTSMVNDFTGSFSYNLPVISIPGPNGMGYALSLSYQNATSVEEEASWVGLGWTLNPGSISRAKRGFPDEYKGAEVEYWNKVRDNWTASVTKRLGVEAWSGNLSADLYTTQRYNNYLGYGYISGVSLGVLGLTNVNFAEADGKTSWGVSISPLNLLGRLTANKDDHSQDKTNPEAWTRELLQKINAKHEGSVTSMNVGNFGLSFYNDFVLPTNTSSYTAQEWMAAISLQGDPFADIGLQAGIEGSVAVQSNVPKVIRNAYGYMYSGTAENIPRENSEYERVIMDYYTEKDAPYSKRDRFLGIPFSNADNFMVTGEGLSGSFRLHQRRPGYFRPSYAKSTTNIIHFNLDLHIGSDIGVGDEKGVGDHFTEVDRWHENPPVKFADPSGENEPYFFRFTDDMGGDVCYAGNDDPVRKVPSLIGPQDVWDQVNQGKPSGRSAFIGFNTNDNIHYHPPIDCWDGASNSSVDLLAYAKEKRSDPEGGRISRFISRNGIGDDIGEFAVTKEDGSIYVYGLPVYSREEVDLQFGVQGLSGDSIKENFLAYKYGQASKGVPYSVVGEVRKRPYPTMYLLTEILSPDYIDRTNDGPTADDLGGYVLFDYDRKAGGNDKTGSYTDWYRWRVPYKGLHYHKNSLSDPTDDVGSVQSGYKEVYYLKSIETRTHKAIFETSARRDGYAAETDEKKAAADMNSSSAGDPAARKLYKLDRIRLYAKDGGENLSTLLTTVNFRYDYSLCEGLPNSEMQGEKRSGKLTLKKVWFEHEGVSGVQISPYEFGYEYPLSTSYPDAVAERYPDIVGYGENWTSAQQNPDYSPFDIDRWGNYQCHGQDRFNRFISWVNQHPEPEFDPAAWQLKRIKLPSGGEIRVQYEQNRYRHVQQKDAMVMANLTDVISPGKYRVNLEELGFTAPFDADEQAEIGRLKKAIRKAFIENGEYIYFKFLYALEGDNTALDLCSSEFITGYANVKEVGPESDNTELWIQLGNPDSDPEDDLEDNYTLPDNVCLDFVRTQRAGVIQTGKDCDPSRKGIPPATNQESVAKVLQELFFSFGDVYVNEENTCKHINEANSWLRIPTTRPKLGGGIRVKRLLMFDPGVEGGPDNEDAALYGTEYLYETADGQCSGVATNEPPVGREENPLVGLIDKRESKSEVEPIISAGALGVSIEENGREQFEGPLGESIMPGASVGYSRVVVTNIHQGKTGTGHLVEEFYTAYDYPFDLQYSTSPSPDVRALKTDMTALDGPPLVRQTFGLSVARFSRADIWRTQGFRFVLNSMNGKPRSVTKYSGEYRDPNAAIVEQVAYDYYEPGEELPVMTGPAMTDITMKSPGKEMEVVLADRTVQDIVNDFGLEGDLVVYFGALFPLPFGSVNAAYVRQETILSTHVATKIIRYPAVQKRVSVTKDGITDVTEYIGFDAKSGKPVLTRSYDGYHGLSVGSPATVRDGSYYSVALPAWRYYPAMGQIAERQGMAFASTDAYSIEKRFEGSKHYLLVTMLQPSSEPTILNLLAPGDLVELQSPVSDTYYDRLGVYNVGNIAGNRIELLPASYSLVNDYPVRGNIRIKVLRVANTNQLTTNAGSFTTYGKEPTSHPAP